MILSVPWGADPGSLSLEERVPPPPGTTRLSVPEDSFGAWLRKLPVKNGTPDVLLFDGRPKARQDVHALVFDVDTGARDLQQCADAVMRLYAEYQRAIGKEDEICFRFTSGDAISWKRWREGERVLVRGNSVRWSKTRRARDASYQNFRAYLEEIFLYAGTSSLQRDLPRVEDPSSIEPGDVFIRGGFPGHAVLVMDVVEDAKGARRFLLAQSFMPAQQIHLLYDPENEGSIWYNAEKSGELVTPEWRFLRSDLRRFPRRACR